MIRLTIKHALVLLFLAAVWFFGVHPQFDDVQKEIEPDYTKAIVADGKSKVSSDIDVYTLIGTLSGLLLAGAISGFFQLTYSRCLDSEGGYSRSRLFLGDLATGLKLAVIGILLTLVIEAVFRYQFTRPLFSSFVLLGGVLYIALVLYDVYDYLCIGLGERVSVEGENHESSGTPSS